MKFKPGDLVKPSNKLKLNRFSSIRPSAEQKTTCSIVVDKLKYNTSIGEVIKIDNNTYVIWWPHLGDYNRFTDEEWLTPANE